ncbi:MAG TPA: hypothetical protein VF937_07145 [Chloroflexota bacterium]
MQATIPATIAPATDGAAAGQPPPSAAIGLDCPTDAGHSVSAAFQMWGPGIPFVAVIFAVLLYAAPQGWLLGLEGPAPWLRSNPVWSGTAMALLTWLVLALSALVFRATAADQANARNYSELCQRLRSLNARLDAITCTLAPPILTEAAEAIAETRSYVAVLRQELARPGLRWVLGTGYINLWTLIHHAEEALLQVEPVSEVIRGALHDKMRIVGSTIDAEAQRQLLTELLLAVNQLDPAAVSLFGVGAGAASNPPAPPGVVIVNDPHLVVNLAGPASSSTAQARAALRHVRANINDFRDGLWDALVRSRNHLLATMAVTGVITYLLLALALDGQLAKRPSGGATDFLSDPIVAAAAFYLLGALVGLFHRLSVDSQTGSDVDDYGLTMARSVLVPVLSGLAAVLGVFIVALLPATFNGDLLAPGQTTSIVATPTAPGPIAAPAPVAAQPSAPATAPITVRPAPNLGDVYALGKNSFGLVIAAVFGLTPGLLISAIQRVPEQYKSALKNSEATSPG